MVRRVQRRGGVATWVVDICDLRTPGPILEVSLSDRPLASKTDALQIHIDGVCRSDSPLSDARL